LPNQKPELFCTACVCPLTIEHMHSEK
jgi:hypothetical protein